ncbi:MAG: D-Ala-D-Ala carboxypeptidase family metallohydrolase [Pseudomonadota bacterium]
MVRSARIVFAMIVCAILAGCTQAVLTDIGDPSLGPSAKLDQQEIERREKRVQAARERARKAKAERRAASRKAREARIAARKKRREERAAKAKTGAKASAQSNGRTAKKTKKATNKNRAGSTVARKRTKRRRAKLTPRRKAQIAKRRAARKKQRRTARKVRTARRKFGKSYGVLIRTPWKCVPGSLKKVIRQVSQRYGRVVINSTHRSRAHNRRVGGRKGSYHLKCRAIDFNVYGNTRGLTRFLRNHPSVGGFKRYPSGYFHIDNGPRRTW